MEIWHNPRCSKSRQALALIEEAGADHRVRRYLDEPPTVDELRATLAKLGMQPWELVRTGEDVYRSLGMADWGHDDPGRWLEAMVANPKLIERPVVIAGESAVIGRPPTEVERLL